MAHPLQKPFDAIAPEDLQLLIDHEVAEGQNLEYKEQGWGHGDEEVREMLRDISAMANAYGGYIFLGVQERNDDSGIPVRISGIKSRTANMERERIQASCLVNMDRRIPGFKIRTIPIDKHTSVVAIYVPRSLRAPHMVTFRGLYQFWVRHDRQKSKMSVEEIADLFLHTRSLVDDAQSFLRQRRTEILEEIKRVPFCVLRALPLLLTDEIVDTTDTRLRELMKCLPEQDRSGFNLDFSRRLEFEAHPTLFGLEIMIPNLSRLQIFRNGYVEVMIDISEGSRFVLESRQPSAPIFNPNALAGYTVSFLSALAAFKEHLMIEYSYLLFVSLFNVRGYRLSKFRVGARAFEHRFEVWGKDHLEIPASEVPSLENVDIVAKSFVDRIYQAFHYERSPCFENGFFRPDS